MKKLIVILSLAFSFSAMAESNYTCFGTEPFWGMELTKNKLIVGFFGDSSIEEDLISRQTAQGLGEEYVFVASTKNATATIITGECSDGMSENIYSHHVVYKSSSTTLYGCCNKKIK